LHEKYFQILEDYFGIHHKQMKRKGQTTLEASEAALDMYSPKLAESVLETLGEELARLDWEGTERSVSRQGGVKAYLESPWDALASPKPTQRLSLYADTTIISRPLLAFKAKQREWHPMVVLQFAIADALNLLQLKDLFLADVTPPIAVLVRPLGYATPESSKICGKIQYQDCLGMWSQMFDREFSSVKEFEDFVMKNETLGNLCKSAKNPGLFSREQDFSQFLAAHLRSQMNLVYGRKREKFTGPEDPKLLVEGMSVINGPLGIANSQLFSCGYLGAQPTAEDLYEWRFLVWKFRHDCETVADRLKYTAKDSLVMNALQLDGFGWLGNVPIEGIVRMREEGELQNIRDILSRGIERIQGVSDEDFAVVTRQVGYNLDQEFKRHRAQLKTMDERFRRSYKFNLASLTVGGSVAVMSAMFPPLATLAGLLGSASVTKTVYDLLKERSMRSELRRKPVALLFAAYQDTNAQTQQGPPGLPPVSARPL
jgi:hypothetical protein